ncbi:MAG: hypothetical protein ACFNKL_04070 [Treponema sp.]
MDKKDFKEKMRDGMDKFLESSKKVLGAAGSAVQDFSDKSVIRIEKSQLESKLHEQYRKLGEYAAGILSADASASIGMGDSKVSEFLSEINNISKEIEVRSNLLKKKDESAGNNA